ncbi:MarR family transcriptional regulator [Rhodococcus antarcticus]|uniref:MarR family transcriptional regulator n=1 Tax=Rhodococcus antarcticus TaxID=2987751 RepID=A0ABY6P4E5_9NOCA|nr:MarR family transcriptional regulator [Rhodococcus antarcticus]UZJ26542.1 MarR family transcriptional regulator [Rhodococcus antarcticus]
MLAARALVAVAARSVVEVEAIVSMSQLRILVLVATRKQVNLGSVATELGVHPSNASRACDRLVEAGLLQRRDSTADRRNLVLELSLRGEALVRSVVENRRAAMQAILSKMSTQDRVELTPALRAFAAAAGENPADAGDARLWLT